MHRTGTDKAANLSRARARILEASRAGANLIVLPECFNSPYGTQHFPNYAETLFPSPPTPAQSPSYHLLSDLAKETETHILGGSIPEVVAATTSTPSESSQSVPASGSENAVSKKYHNTSLLFSPTGALIATHRKLHLFDIDIPGKITFQESSILSPGNKITLADLPEYGTISLSICYDIRFPEPATISSRAPHNAFLLLYPGAFNMTTGPMHWELLARARAVDNQVYVALCSPARDTDAGYVAYGHSMIVGPDARVLAEAGKGEQIVYAELSGENIEEVRRGIPIQGQRRWDVYPDVSQIRERKFDL